MESISKIEKRSSGFTINLQEMKAEVFLITNMNTSKSISVY